MTRVIGHRVFKLTQNVTHHNSETIHIYTLQIESSSYMSISYFILIIAAVSSSYMYISYFILIIAAGRSSFMSISYFILIIAASSSRFMSIASFIMVMAAVSRGCSYRFCRDVLGCDDLDAATTGARLKKSRLKTEVKTVWARPCAPLCRKGYYFHYGGWGDEAYHSISEFWIQLEYKMTL